VTDQPAHDDATPQEIPEDVTLPDPDGQPADVAPVVEVDHP